MSSRVSVVPDATVARLPLYHQALVELGRSGETTVSSERLAELAGVNAAKVRKDLSSLGSYGTRGVGYDIEFLTLQVGRTLGLTGESSAVIVGFGNLGQALSKYSGFADRGFPVVAVVDVDRTKLGKRVNDLVVRHLDELPELVAELDISVGVIATPQDAAQLAADALVAAGVQSILSFAPSILEIPESVPWRKVDLATELQILSYYQARVSHTEHPT
ncbi:MAG: redox-sensing transcriptional repressor Rex [Acidimicrobiales bacterium]